MFRLLCLCALVGSLTATTGCSALSALFGKKGADAGTEDPGTDDIDQATDDTDVVDDIEDVVDVPDVKKDAADAKNKDVKDTKDSGPDLQDEPTDEDVATDDIGDDATDLTDAVDGQDSGPDIQDTGPDVQPDVDVFIDSGIAVVGCKVDLDCGAVPANSCAAKWLCLFDAVKQVGTCVASDPAENGTPCDDNNKCTTADVCNKGSCVGKLNTCEDSNPCTNDVCKPATGACTNTAGATGVPCTDGDPCTVGDMCGGGDCVAGAKNICDCKVNADCKVQDSLNLCEGTHKCESNMCVLDPATVVTPALCPQDPAQPCQHNQCNPTTGKCAPVNLDNGSPCSDNDLCTFPDLCADGACASQPLACNDNNPCTDDACTPGKALPDAGCKYTPNIEPCDDGDACTGNGVCNLGACTKGDLDPSACACTVDDNCAKYSTKCGGNFICSNKNCVLDPAAVPVKCSTAANTACQTYLCSEDSGQCEFTYSPKETLCDDNNVCTSGDHCDGGGVCVKAQAFNCTDGDPCTNDFCLPAVGCYHPYNSTACTDGSDCTVGDKCTFGKCVGSPYTPGTSTLICQCSADKDCAKYDSNKCQAPHLCSSTKVCTLSGSVAVDPCAAITAKSPCHTYSCNPATGVCDQPNKADGIICSDDNWCTQNDACVSGNCTGGAVKSCDDGNDCTTDPACDPKLATAGCSQHPAKADDTDCTIDDKCQSSPTCQGGVCVGTAVPYDDNNVCTLDSCDPKTGPKHLPTIAGTVCSDGNPCTGEDVKDTATGGVNIGQDTCAFGKCVPAKAKDCHGTNIGPCYTSSCDASQTVATAILDPLTKKYACVQVANTNPCQGGDACIVNQACSGGVCQGGNAKVCDDGNICTDDTCWNIKGDLIPPGTCYFSPHGAQNCDDGSLCTTKDTCSNSGFCVGKVLIFDDGNPCTLDKCDAIAGPSHTPDPNGDCGPLAKCSADDPPKCVFASKPILISEFYIGVANDPKDDWIEIHNPTATDVPIPSYAIQVAAAKPGDGIGWNTLAQTDSAAKILAHGYLLFSRSSTVIGGKAGDVVSSTLDFNHAQQVDGNGVGLVDANSAPIIINVGQVRLYDAKNGLVQDRLCLDAGGCTDMGLDVTPVTLGKVSANSLERKASETSSAESMAYHGVEWLAGNDYVDGAMPNNNFLVRLTPDPQNAKSTPAAYEPACGGNCPVYQVCNYNAAAEACTDDTKCAIGCGSGTYCIGNSCALNLPTHLVFSEILPGGQSDANQQFIEIYNADTVPVELSGFVLQIKTADKVQTDPWANLYQLPAGVTLPPGRYYTIGTAAYAATAGGVDALLPGSLGLDPAGGALRLWNPRTDVGDSDMKDFVGWGATLAYNNNATYVAAPAPTPGNSLERKSVSLADDYADTMKPGGADCLNGNGRDTDHDDQDWFEQDLPGAQSFASGQFEPACCVGTGANKICTCSKGLLCPFTGTDGGKCADPQCYGNCGFQSATSGGGFSCNISLATPACDLTGLVIAEVSPQGPVSTTVSNGALSGASNEYIVLYNRSNQDISLENIYISYRYGTAGGFLKATDAPLPTDVNKKPLSGVIHAFSYYLITPSIYDSKMPAPDFVSTWSWGLDPAKGTVRLSRYDTAGGALTLDHLAWGNDQAINAFGEPQQTKVAAPVCPGVDPFSLLSDGTPCAIRRLPMPGVTASDVVSMFSPWYYAGAGYDSGSNKDNFVTTQTRTPHNSCLQASGACPPNSPGVPQKP